MNSIIRRAFSYLANDSRATLIAAVLPLLLLLHRGFRRPPRHSLVAPHYERVLILGGSSGVGRSIALAYARREARVCVVGRRGSLLEEVVRDCQAGQAGQVLRVTADISGVEGILAVRDVLEREWQGVDTVIVVAGVSALRPLMSVAGVDNVKRDFATREGLQYAADVTALAIKGNYVGPLLAAITFIPMLAMTSHSPSTVLFSSAGGVIPAPTRSLYGSTKGAALLLYQALSIEHPDIAFSYVIPGTIEGDFRASAVDGGSARENAPNSVGLKREEVARRVVNAVDWGERTVWMPGVYRWAHAMYWVWPSFVEWRARVKYSFSRDEMTRERTKGTK